MSREILLGYASKNYDGIFPRLAVATFQKNNSRHLLEWFAWYTLMGVKRFYVYDHMSTDHSVKLWNRLANEFDIVTHSLYGPFSGNAFCNHYLSNYRSDADHDFIIQADGDEFYYPTDTPSLRHALASRIHKEWLFSGLGIYWTMFGSNNQIEWEKGLVTQTYNRRAKLDNPLNFHVKPIVRCGQTAGEVFFTGSYHLFGSRHGFRDMEGYLVDSANMYDSDLRKDDPRPPCHSGIRVNHYYNKSYEYFKTVKQVVGQNADRLPGSPGSHITEEFWRSQDFNDELDNSIWERFGPQLIERIEEIKKICYITRDHIDSNYETL